MDGNLGSPTMTQRLTIEQQRKLRGTCIADPRHELTYRAARTLDETRRDRYSWWEPHIEKKPPRPFRWGPPMLNAPEGAEAELQRVLLKKHEPAALVRFIGLVVYGVRELIWPTPPYPPIEPSRVSRITYPSDYQRQS
jgi:hypothetical protein